jgi:hypothetical protein
MDWLRRLFVEDERERRPPWELGLSDEERAQERRTQAVIDAFLAKPRPPRVTIRDHGPFDALTDTCQRCNLTRIALYSTPIMPPCDPDAAAGSLKR